MCTSRQSILIAAGSGTATGLSFGWQGGWVLTLVGLTLVLSRLAQLKGLPSFQARCAAGLLAVFVFFLYGACHIGLPIAVDPSFSPGTLVFVFGFAVAQAIIAASFAYASFRLTSSNVKRLLLLLPAAWMFREWMTSKSDLASPWLAIGNVQAPGGPLAALFPIGGVFLVGGASLLVSGAVALAITRAAPRLTVFLGICISLLAIAATNRVVWTEPSGVTTIELVQSGSLQHDGSDAAIAGQALRMYADVIESSRAALIVTPQFAIPKVPEALPQGYLFELGARLKAKNADALLGMHFASDTAGQYYNGVTSIGASGQQRYLKQHLFPFGEYIPLPAAFRTWVNSKFDHPRADGARGPAFEEPLLGGGLRLAIAVCYDIAFGNTLRLQAASDTTPETTTR